MIYILFDNKKDFKNYLMKLILDIDFDNRHILFKGDMESLLEKPSITTFTRMYNFSYSEFRDYIKKIIPDNKLIIIINDKKEDKVITYKEKIKEIE